ncbi:MAG: nitroreductase [Chloroflexi bacterium]|nr:nitroreductase [Chloroflexota bacterium]
MDVIEAIRSRRSIRAFKPRAVSREVLEDILKAAVRAPSSSNMQPWTITVVTGGALERLRRDNVEALESEAPLGGDIPPGGSDSVLWQRKVDIAIRLFSLMGIDRDDKAQRAAWRQRGFRFFDAPAAIFLSVGRDTDENRMHLLDIGAVMQNICLAALNYGLGTCIHGQGAMFPDLVTKHIGLPSAQRLVTCISIGYPDCDFPANRLVSPREPLDKVVNWVE